MYIVQLKMEGVWHDFCTRDDLDGALLDMTCWGAIFGTDARILLDGEALYVYSPTA